MFEMVPRSTIIDLCASRDMALERMEDAIRYINDGARIAQEAQDHSRLARGVASFRQDGRQETEQWNRLFAGMVDDKHLEMYRRNLDANAWVNALMLTGMSDMMDRTAKEKFYADLNGNVPPFTVDNFEATFEALTRDSRLIFIRGLATTFANLDRRFKSHDGFKLGSRIILTRVFNEYGAFNYGSHMRDTLADVERVFAVLDNVKPDIGALARQISEDRKGHGYNASQSKSETPYFRINCFLNGNAHLWFKRDDLVDKANKMLGEYYGEVLADAAPSTYSPDDLRSRSGLPAKKLSFYATPDDVCKRIVGDLYLRAGVKALEPSAGTGNIVKYILATGADVDAIEIDPERAVVLRGIRNPRLNVTNANFLTMTARAEYDFVLMNPPFYGTHWMEHVMHAFDFLKDGGTLVAVLPVTAEMGETSKHETFRKWAVKHGGHNPFSDLPEESFAASGTRVNTVILRVRKSSW